MAETEGLVACPEKGGEELRLVVSREAVASSRLGALLGLLVAAVAVVLGSVFALNPVEPCFHFQGDAAASTHCLRSYWAPSVGGDGRAEKRVWHLQAQLSVGTHPRTAKLLVHLDGAAETLLARDLDLSAEEAAAVVAEVRNRSEWSSVMVVDAQTLVAGLANERLTSSSTLEDCVAVVAGHPLRVCSDEIVEARDEPNHEPVARQRVLRAGMVVVPSSVGSTERRLLGLDGDLYPLPSLLSTGGALAVGATSLCIVSPAQAHATAVDVLASSWRPQLADDFLPAARVELEVANGTLEASGGLPNGLGLDGCTAATAPAVRWLPSRSAAAQTWFGASEAVGVSSDEALAEPACGVFGPPEATTSAAAVLACASNPEACSGEEPSLAYADVARRPVLLAWGADGLEGAVVALVGNGRGRANALYGTLDEVGQATWRLALLALLASALGIRSRSGLSAAQLLSRGVHWASYEYAPPSKDAPVGEEAAAAGALVVRASGSKALGVLAQRIVSLESERVLDATLLLARVVQFFVGLEARIANGMQLSIIADALGCVASIGLLAMRVSLELPDNRRLGADGLALGGSSFLLDGLKALLSVSAAFPTYEPASENSFSTLARVAVGALLAAQVLPRALASVGVAYAAAKSPLFSQSFQAMSGVAVLLWLVHVCAASLLLSTGAIRPVLFASGRAMEDLSLLLFSSAGVVLVLVAAATSGVFARAERAVCIA